MVLACRARVKYKGHSLTNLGHFQVGSFHFRSLTEVYIPCRSLLEAVYTLNSPPVVSFKLSYL